MSKANRVRFTFTSRRADRKPTYPYSVILLITGAVVGWLAIHPAPLSNLELAGFVKFAMLGGAAAIVGLLARSLTFDTLLRDGGHCRS